jgi:CubicO group peptidase (beta-lactamase class C family)
MKSLKKIISLLIISGISVVLLAYATNTDYLLKAVRTIYLKGHVTAFLDDYHEFDNRTIAAGPVKYSWPKHGLYNTTQASDRLEKKHQEMGTIAYVVIKNDSIFYEQYYQGYSDSSNTNSFSMVKSMVSGLLGKSIMNGTIKSLDQPVGDFFPEFNEGLAAQTTVGDLASMSSGTNWDEAYYSPLSITTRAYFDDYLREVILNLKVVDTPGQKFKYASGDTQLLGMVLEKANGKTLSQQLTEYFWQPLGAEHDAYWQLDSEESGIEKAYCCLASNALDFARFGKLYKDHGNWMGAQILDSAYVAKSISPRFEDSPQYGYGWWMHPHMGHDFFMMKGHLGQYVMVNPTDNLIIVRLGHLHSKREQNRDFGDDIPIYIEEAYKMLQQAGI